MLLNCHFSFVPFNLKQFLSFFFFFLTFGSICCCSETVPQVAFVGGTCIFNISLDLESSGRIGQPQDASTQSSYLSIMPMLRGLLFISFFNCFFLEDF